MFKDDREESSGGMALARAQRTAAQSPSSRNSKATNSTLRRPDSPSNALARTTHVKSSSTLSRSSSSSSLASSSKLPAAHLSARDRLKAGFDSSSFIKLNTEKRDRRSIEEVEMDMRMKKNGGAAVSRERDNADMSHGKRRAADSTGMDPKRSKSSPLLQVGLSHRATNSISRAPMPSPLAPRPSSSNMTKSSSTGQRRKASSSEESDDSSSSREEETRNRSSASQSRRAKEKAATRDEIWKLMGRDRSRDIGRDYDSDESGSDMEVGGAELLREEERTRRLAEREDREEAERAKIRAEQKRLKKVA